MVNEAKATDQPVSLKLEEISLPLPEAENILRALRGGEVDGVVVARPDGERVYMLSGAEHPYRVMIETMNEGAVTLTEGGGIAYCNKRFAEMVGTPLEELTGSSMSRLVAKRYIVRCSKISFRASAISSGLKSRRPMITSASSAPRSL